MPDDSVNPQITDAITQTNVKVLGESSPEAMSLSYQALAHSTGLSMESASHTQAGMQQVANSATAALCTIMVKAASG
ncbi:MAG: RebB family R body protein [Sphingomonadales bacterium]